MSRKSELLEACLYRRAVVGVIGLGYVGLPLALAFVEQGFRVVGFDTDRRKVAALNDGRCYVQHIASERVRAAVSSGKLRVSSDFEGLGECDVSIICVPTPLTETRDPDLSFVTPQVIAEQDALIVVTDHANVDYGLIQQHARLIIDARGVYPRALPNVVRA